MGKLIRHGYIVPKKDVFLGGSCGTTTWRQAIAIPALKAANLTYFDPQRSVGEWTEASEVTEHDAKESADILLFVFTPDTRSVASLAEAAYFLAARRSMVLVLPDLPDDASVGGIRLSPEERRDLNRGRFYVRAMAERHGVPIFDAVEAAVQHIITLGHAARPEVTGSEVTGTKRSRKINKSLQVA